MYPYILVCHLTTKTLYRCFRYESIPEGFVKVISYRGKVGRYRYHPYNLDGELKSEYWSLPRIEDFLRN